MTRPTPSRIFAQTTFNGDGIIPADSSDDPFVKGVINDCIGTYGSVQDRSGKPGIDTTKLTSFFTDLQGYSDWWSKAEKLGDSVLPLGDKTAGAFATMMAVAGKIDDYFGRARLAAYDPRAQAALNRQESEYLNIAANDLSITADEVAGFPLAQVAADQPLPLVRGLNPAWAEKIAGFRASAIVPILGERDSLTEADWQTIRGRFAAFGGWQGSKSGSAVEKLGLERIRAILASPAKGKIEELIAKDQALAGEANAIAGVDKLVRFYRDLYTLVRNFVNFGAFYNQNEKAVFQAGRLYLDQRGCDLCVRVDDVTKHASLAPLSRLYLAYCDLTRRGGADKMQIAAAFTAGDSDNLMVGRNGLFYDRKGGDWDATITRVFENPISLRQAFWSPYKKVLRWVEEMIAKRAAAADASSTQMLTSAAGTAAEAAATGKAPPAAKPKFDIGTIAALGVAVGGITAAMGVILQAFFGLGWAMPLGLVALMILISGPSMVIAWLKLRQRNLGPLLDANGWAVNTRAKINIPFGRALTSRAQIPLGAKRNLVDPYHQSIRGRVWTIVILAFLLVMAGLWYFGAIEHACNWWRGEADAPPTTQPVVAQTEK